MTWTREQLFQHPKRKSLLAVNTKSQIEATEKTPVPFAKNTISFVVVGNPMAKPRMTQQDKWKRRPCVLRYRDYCDRIKEAAPAHVLTSDVYAIDITAYLAVPKSWSQKKKTAAAGQRCRAKPDWDNISKAVCDALFQEDSMIASGRTRKLWCLPGEQRTEIKVWFFAEKAVLPE